MNIPKYWANDVEVGWDPFGKAYSFSCWQWSNNSEAEARELAVARARELARRVQSGWEPGRYLYGDRPLREEIKQGIATIDGKEAGVVTRNAHGVLVLNAPSVMFVDIDFAQESQDVPIRSLADGIRRLFGKPLESPESPEQPNVERIEAWARSHPELDIRIYRTFAGLRCLVTNETFDPTDSTAQQILTDLNADPLYTRLCKNQECFRARLTAKPWRCGAGRPPSRYPWQSAAQRLRYRAWEQRYDAIASRYSTCKFVKEIGAGRVHPEVQPVLDFHESTTRPYTDASLA
jgi:hypothetical protein